MAVSSTPHYLGTADVADLLGISPMHVGRLARIGRIPVAGTKGRRNDRLFAADAIAQLRGDSATRRSSHRTVATS